MKAFLYAHRWKWIMLFLILALLRFPIAIASRLIPAPWSLQGVSGTLWSGQASALGLNGMIIQQHVHWNWQARALLQAKLQWQIEGRLSDAHSKVLLDAGWRNIDWRDVRLSLPLEPFTRLSEQAQALRLGGVIHLDSPLINLQQPWQLQGKLTHFSSALTQTANPLGSYQFQIDVAKNGVGNWHVSTLNGTLKAQGSGDLDIPQQHIQGNIQLEPDEATLLPLKPALALLPRNGDAYTVQIGSNLR